ncbi:probable insulin-like peptide 5 [Drosophila ficusphila]|uniref:probable insulin-like peptide 5 n=1 Tax=Drosophila ficusphila TaxID=30025 RepID=UPI0007E81226|nr:probable insulin-like peptide 5 [Drosophila ficusphila]
MFRTAIPVLLILLPVVLHSAESVNMVRACGPHLTQLIEALCPNGVIGMFEKRDPSLGLLDYGDKLMAMDNNDVDDEPQNSRINSIVGMRRAYRGIVDECCYNACTYTEILKLCKK